MLTIERLRAMPPADKDGYLRSLHNQIGIDERDAMRNQSMAEEHERKAIECREYVIGTVRKAFTGSGSAKKFRVWQTARERGFVPETEHEADACCVLWNVAHERHGDQGELLSRYDPLFIEAGKA